MRTRTLKIHSASASVTGKVVGEAGALGVLLAHGAGAGQLHPWMVTMRTALVAQGLFVMTFNYRYTEFERRRPDSPRVLLDVHEAAAARLLEYCDRVVLAGKSMGGRMGSHLVAERGVDPTALIYYGYPLVPLGKGEPRSTAHLEEIGAPQLFFAGARDRLSPPDLIATRAARLPSADVVVVPDADHSFRVPKRAARTDEAVLTDIAAKSARWLHKAGG
jgi:predicted alpha/beta-hydrolase family hydrolase